MAAADGGGPQQLKLEPVSGISCGGGGGRNGSKGR